MNVCPDCGMGPRGIESEDDRDMCQNCGYTTGEPISIPDLPLEERARLWFGHHVFPSRDTYECRKRLREGRFTSVEEYRQFRSKI